LFSWKYHANTISEKQEVEYMSENAEENEVFMSAEATERDN